MLKLALIGKDVRLSPSPQIHSYLLGKLGAECSFELLSVRAEEFPRRALELFESCDGFFVTVPYKREILPWLSSLSEEAQKCGSVNFVLSSSRRGFNTDGGGFSLMLETAGIHPAGKKTLVLGIGGAGRSCVSALMKSGAEVFVYEKDEERLKRAHADLKGFTPLFCLEQSFDLIVNCTGVGMHETEGQVPLVRTREGERPFSGKFLKNCAADLIYAPKESEFLKTARLAGAETLNGESMLFYQAYLADCILLSIPPDPVRAKTYWRKYQEEKA